MISKTIPINKFFSIRSDNYQWILMETFYRLDDGKPRAKTEDTFYPCIQKCLNSVRNKMAKKCTTTEELLKALAIGYELDLSEYKKFKGTA